MGLPDKMSQYSMIPQTGLAGSARVQYGRPNSGLIVSQAGIGEQAPGRETGRRDEDKGVARHWQAARELLRIEGVGCLQAWG